MGDNGLVFDEPCEIPTLDDILEYFKDKKDVIIIVEIKNTQDTFPAKLNEVVEKYNAYDQVCSISFTQKLTTKMQQVAPKIPTADLNGAGNRDQFINYLKFLGESHGAINPSKSLMSADVWAFRNYMARGYLPFYWTQYNVADTLSAVGEGCMGITTNHANALGDFVKHIITPTGLTVANEAVLGTAQFPVSVKTYNGKTLAVQAKVLAYDADETGADAVLIFAEGENTSLNRITQTVRIDFTATEEPNEPETPNNPSDSTETPNNPSDSTGNSSSNSTESPSKPSQPTEPEGKKGCGGVAGGGMAAVAALAFICATKKLKKLKR